MRANLGTSDSYSTHKGIVLDVEELKELIKSNGFNRYRGGKQDSFGCVCDQFLAGYTFKKVLRISYDSEEECQRVEDEIRPLFDVFSSREWVGESV